MNLWLQAGKLLIDSAGRLILCDECPCVEDVTGTGTVYDTFNDCCGFDAVSEWWRIDLPGITSGTLSCGTFPILGTSNCSTFTSGLDTLGNTYYTLQWSGNVGGNCSFTSFVKESACSVGGTIQYQLQMDCAAVPSSGYMRIRARSGPNTSSMSSRAVYRLALGSFNPLGNNVFDLESSPECATWPATLTAVPIPDPFP